MPHEATHKMTPKIPFGLCVSRELVHEWYKKGSGSRTSETGLLIQRSDNVAVMCKLQTDMRIPSTSCIRGCIQKFPDWPPGARTANGTALCH
jgi:hypothetical protein